MVARGVSLTFTLPEGVALGEVLGRTAYPSGRLVQVPLPDFSAAQSEKLVVRLTVNGQTAGSTVNVTDFALAYTDLVKSGPGAAQVHLAALVTGQKDEMLAKRDKAAVVTATRALSAENYRRAAEAIDRGEATKAKAAIHANELLFEDAAGGGRPRGGGPGHRREQGGDGRGDGRPGRPARGAARPGQVAQGPGDEGLGQGRLGLLTRPNLSTVFTRLGRNRASRHHARARARARARLPILTSSAANSGV